MFTTIPSGKYRLSSDHRCETRLGGVSTWMGDRLEILRVVSSVFPPVIVLIFCETSK